MSHGNRGIETCLTVAVTCALVASGCALTRQTGSVEQSGFLGDYSQLRPGTEDEAQLIYISPTADFPSYDAALIDSVAIWQSGDDSMLPAEEAQALTDYAYTALHEQLEQDYRIVDVPGPGVLRVRVAITEAKGARVVGNAVTSVIPQLRLLSTVAGVASDTQVFVGKAGIEVEITDALSGERLAAAVDGRSGTKAFRGGLAKWSGVKNAFDYWAERLRMRLAQERGTPESS